MARARAEKNTRQKKSQLVSGGKKEENTFEAVERERSNGGRRNKRGWWWRWRKGWRWPAALVIGKGGKRSWPKTRKPASNERHLTSVARARANRRPDFSGSH